jgi:homospermidine synthase
MKPTDISMCDDGEEKHYNKKVEEDSVKNQYGKIKQILNEGVQKNYITRNFANQMLPVKPKAGSFYLQPKVHKDFDRVPKGRPIVPGCGSNTEIISWFCDQAVKDKVREQDSFIEDTPDTCYNRSQINVYQYSY